MEELIHRETKMSLSLEDGKIEFYDCCINYLSGNENGTLWCHMSKLLKSPFFQAFVFKTKAEAIPYKAWFANGYDIELQVKSELFLDYVKYFIYDEPEKPYDLDWMLEMLPVHMFYLSPKSIFEDFLIGLYYQLFEEKLNDIDYYLETLESILESNLHDQYKTALLPLVWPDLSDEQRETYGHLNKYILPVNRYVADGNLYTCSDVCNTEDDIGCGSIIRDLPIGGKLQIYTADQDYLWSSDCLGDYFIAKKPEDKVLFVCACHLHNNDEKVTAKKITVTIYDGIHEPTVINTKRGHFGKCYTPYYCDINAPLNVLSYSIEFELN
jgi:hypothetical protein